MGKSDYRITIHPGYVLVERPSDYKVVLNEQPAMLRQLSAYCQDSGCHKVLILGPKTKVNLSVADIHFLGKEIAKLNLRIAMVESHDASNEDEDFLETVAMNYGSSIQFFDTEKEAKDWLVVS